jgi:hypothetical protein
MSTKNERFSGPGPDQIYDDFLKKGVFSLPKCQDCQEFHFFPRVVCPHCGSFNLEWTAVSGKGEVYSTTTVRRKPERGGNYNVCHVILEEGPRLMSRVEGVDPLDVKIGDQVSAVIKNDEDSSFIVFVPAPGV